MAAVKTSNSDGHFSVERLKEWPEPESVSLMEMLAREDIDEAVYAILFRENYIVKRLDTYFQHEADFKERRREMLHKRWVENVAKPLQQRVIEKVISYRRPGKSEVKFEYCAKHTDKPTKASPPCECLFRRQQELREMKGTSYQQSTGKQNDAQKEHTKETRKAPHFGRSPQFMHASHGIVPKEKPRAPPRSAWNKPSTHSFEKPVCKSKSYLPQEETPDLSQLAFERQFRSSKLRPENKEIEKCLVSGTQPPRPRSWAAADSRHRQVPPALGRRVMTAELLGKHLASLQGAARSGLQWS
ncbi:protein FAM228A isoform X1 [Peromyscus maniculatus bairdii]|uniref:protein FAM228A isoform X1 n=1 Tax=Peromyscus maniculatus bairdii TaxID=230844 RepID=UPI00042A9C20|nr:protein FAM228A isoform X1 [Peromyscus maniculatus bairdii]XP_042123175.1 protein FAM228A isoform X2 [Peromyscus maniculatus bairdii]